MTINIILENPREGYKKKVSRKVKKVTKSVWGMPRLSEAKKDVTSCDKLWGPAHTV